MDLNKNYILIAEDDEDDRMLLRSAFSETPENIELVFVENGVDLIEHFARIEAGIVPTLPSLLILDLNMPKKNGKEVLSELQTKDYFNAFKTVIFSTTSCESEKGKCMELGISGYFVKPTGYKSLLELVTRFKSLAGIPDPALQS